MQNFKKMQKSALKICIYQNNVVLLHRQNNLCEADEPPKCGFFNVRMCK